MAVSPQAASSSAVDDESGLVLAIRCLKCDQVEKMVAEGALPSSPRRRANRAHTRLSQCLRARAETARPHARVQQA